MDKEILTIGMPAGSLANPKRGGNLISFLEHSGFRTKGYENGGPTSFSTVNFMFGWDGRPQEFGTQIALGELDVAISGDDWIEERRLELETEYGKEIKLEKVLSLKRGFVRLVGIVDGKVQEKTTEDFLKNLLKEKQLITVVSELPYMALDWIRKKLIAIGESELAESWSVQKYKTPPKVEKGVLIYETWGKTEAKITNMAADIGLEITQSGSALKNYGLRIIDEYMKSETGIWINPEIRKDSMKNSLLEMFLINLYGTINAENKVLMLFNVPSSSKESIEKYLSDNNLYADEPTVIPGSEYSQYSIQIEIDREDVPLSKVRYELIKMGAKNIDTLPLLSSIPDLSALIN